jgi:hypothetical protein
MILARCPAHWCSNDGKIVQLKAPIYQVQLIDQDATFREPQVFLEHKIKMMKILHVFE